jgi:hypothetical protein
VKRRLSVAGALRKALEKLRCGPGDLRVAVPTAIGVHARQQVGALFTLAVVALSLHGFCVPCMTTSLTIAPSPDPLFLTVRHLSLGRSTLRGRPLPHLLCAQLDAAPRPPGHGPYHPGCRFTRPDVSPRQIPVRIVGSGEIVCVASSDGSGVGAGTSSLPTGCCPRSTATIAGTSPPPPALSS